MAIEALVFDWGGVLAGDTAAGSAEIEQRLNLPAGSMPGLMGLHPYETDLGNVWHRRELGLATSLEWARWYSDRVHAAGGPTIPPELIVESEPARFTLTPNDLILDTVRRLRAARCRLAICTNNFVEIGDVWRAGLPIDLFDLVVASCEVGVRKPDPEMFSYVSAQLGISASSTVLLDDQPANVAGARNAGWHAVLVGADHAAAIAELDALLA